MKITERWLMDTAGYPAFKAGRQLFRAGATAEVSFENGLLRGIVRSGKRQQVAGLKIKGATDIENLCRCPRSQREGAVCEHSMAVAFAWMDLELAGEGASSVRSAEIKTSRSRDVKKSAKPSRIDLSGSSLPIVSIRIEKDFLKIWEKNKLPLRLSIESCAAGDPKLNPTSLAACARFSSWLGKNGVDPASLPPFLVLSRSQSMDFFDSVRDYPWIQLGENGRPLVVPSQPLRPRLLLEWGEDDEVEVSVDEVTVNLRLDMGDSHGGNSSTSLLWAADAAGRLQAWIFDSSAHTLTPTSSAADATSDLMAELLAPDGSGSVERPLRSVVKNLDTLNDQFVLDLDSLGVPLRLASASPSFELALEGSLNSVTAQLLVIYPTSDGDLRLPAGLDCDLEGEPADDFPIPDAEQWGLYWQRNLPTEKVALDLLESVGFKAVDDRGRWVLSGREAVLAFFGSSLPEWYHRNDVEVSLGERLVHVTRGLERVTPQISIQNSGESWFECQFAFQSASGSSMSEAEVRRLMASGRREVALGGRAGADGEPIGVIDTQAVSEWSEVLHDVDAEQVRPGLFRIAAHHREYLAATIDGDEDCKNTTQPSYEQYVAELKEVLRAYQGEGVAWLCQRLLAGGIHGAVLADEMGLGKTLQTLAAIRALRQMGVAEFCDRPSLVVAPTSLLSNWAAEAEKFTPELKTLILHGAARKDEYRNISKADLVITSYGVLARDTEQLSKSVSGFGLMVLDEASYIRNPATQAARSVREVKAAARLALTGTPVENSVRDLWSILDFAVPGSLGSREEFKQRYEAVLGGDRPLIDVLARLKRRVQPHLLRRTKRKVARDLPDKIEQVLYCDLNPKQQGLYAQLVDASRETVRKALGKTGAGANQARMAVLTTLLRLRQVCCDPRLLDAAGKAGEKADSPGGEMRENLAEIGSSKLELLHEALREARDGGHKVLIFSQFVSMLKLIGDQLSNDECDFAYLDGGCSAKQRTVEVKRFQTDDSIAVFLISLKAGGYGLNLTAADTVIHFDPWWNPAVEAQATDRAHRIGQERPVTSYKLICRGTVEEKILRLQQRKRAAFGGTISDDDEVPMMNGLSDDELREVLEI